MVKLIVLFFILGACGLISARSSHKKNWNSDKIMREMKPRKQHIKVIAPRKHSNESKFLKSFDEDRFDKERFGDDSFDKKSFDKTRFRKGKSFKHDEESFEENQLKKEKAFKHNDDEESFEENRFKKEKAFKHNDDEESFKENQLKKEKAFKHNDDEESFEENRLKKKKAFKNNNNEESFEENQFKKERAFKHNDDEESFEENRLKAKKAFKNNNNEESFQENRFKKERAFKHNDDEEDSDFRMDDDSDSDDGDLSNRNQPIATDKQNGNCGIPFVKPNLKQTKIVGGDVAVPHSWPWQVQIKKTAAGDIYLICGGTIISPSTILTAAHCVYDIESKERIDKSNLHIVAGAHLRTSYDSPTQKRNLKEVKVHSGYDPYDFNNDIAIFILSEPLVFNHNISAACLPQTALADNTQCYSTGWGYTNIITEQASDVLLQVLLPSVKSIICENNLEGNFDKETMICAGNPDPAKNACNGDSGGPYVSQNKNNQWTVDGITSSGTKDCTFIGIKTRVYHFKSWIEQNMKY